MPTRTRSNPLALAVLISLYERPMHPTRWLSSSASGTVRLSYGPPYGVVESLERRGLVEAQDTERAGRLPERTVYRLTTAGRVEMRDWLTELIFTLCVPRIPSTCLTSRVALPPSVRDDH